MEKVSKREWIYTIIIFITSLVAMTLFINKLVGFVLPAYFYKNGGILNPYTNVNVVSRWAYFSFLTYIALLAFAIWGILKFCALVFKSQKLYNLVNNSYVVLFICSSQLIVLVFYTAYQLITRGNFGLWSNNLRAVLNLVENLIVHYVITTIAGVYMFFHKFQRVKFAKCLYSLIFLAVYYGIVKITGMYCYQFEWYPYPIFSCKGIWYALFGSLINYNVTHAALILSGAIIGIVGLYVLLIYLFTRLINKRLAKSAAEDPEV